MPLGTPLRGGFLHTPLLIPAALFAEHFG
jgi:hypothetical protein